MTFWNRRSARRSGSSGCSAAIGSPSSSRKAGNALSDRRLLAAHPASLCPQVAHGTPGAHTVPRPSAAVRPLLRPGVDPAHRGGLPRHHPARAPPLQDPSAGLPLARMGGPDPARPMEEPARGRRPPRPRPPHRRPLPRGPDGNAIGRGVIRRFDGSSVRLQDDQRGADFGFA